MAIAIQTPDLRTTARRVGPDRVLLHKIPWELYERLREEESNWAIRMAYDDGDLELMSPSLRHEEFGFRFDLFITTLARVLGFKIRGLASTTWKKRDQEKAKEADACYYIQTFERIRGKDIDLEIHPPPDLAIEVEVTRSAIDSLKINAGIEIPEIWRFDGQALFIHLRQIAGSYTDSDQSLALPFLSRAEIEFWLKKSIEIQDDMEWSAQLEAYARAELAPRLEQA